jgi:hypothetical protein
MNLQKVMSKKNFFKIRFLLPSWEGQGRKWQDPDPNPDPPQNVMDPQHWL